MKIAIGSINPVKIQATKLAFQKVWPNKKWEVVGLEIPSKVSSQPKSDLESIKGATNRAKGALAKSKADFGVGIEGGLSKIDGNWYDTAWIVVIDKAGTKAIGSTINMPTPQMFIDKVNEGMEIGHIDDLIFKQQNSKHAQGHFGLMTKNALTRQSAYVEGTISALARFIRPEIF